MKTEQEHNNEQCTMNNVQWKKVKLGEVGEIISGGTPSTTNETFWDGDVLFVTPLDLGRNNKIDSTLRTISELGVKNSSANKIKAHSLAISTRAPIGLMSIVNQDFTTNQGCKSIQFYDSYDSEFFYYYLSYNVEKIQRYGQGTTFMEISKTDFSNLEFTVPDLAAQRRIAAILASADKVIAATQKTIAKYKQMKQGMMEDLLNEQCTMNNVQWKKVRLGECCAVNPKTDTTKVLDDDVVVLVRMEDVSNDGFITSFSERTYKSLQKRGLTIFQNEDVIFAKITPCMENGKGALVRNMKSQICMGSTEFHVLRAYDNVSINFIYQLTISKRFRQRAEMQMTGSAGQQRVPTAFLEDCLISIPFKNNKPDLTAQRRIAAILSGIDAKIAAEGKVLQKYEKVKEGLMERLLNEQ